MLKSLNSSLRPAAQKQHEGTRKEKNSKAERAFTKNEGIYHDEVARERSEYLPTVYSNKLLPQLKI